jgi:hypothetical protein
MDGIRRLAARPEIEVSTRVHRDLVATGRYEQISDARIRREVGAFYAAIARLSEPIRGQAELVAALDRELPLGPWRFVFGETASSAAPLSYQETVVVLRDRGFGVQIRGIMHGLEERRVTLDQLHAQALAAWESIRTQRDGS